MTYPVQLHVQAAGVTHRLPLSVPPPQRGGAGVAVCATEAGAAGRVLLQRQRLSSLGQGGAKKTCDCPHLQTGLHQAEVNGGWMDG